tara:strand:- start:2204 stop:3070 length:867 start_codon:yes stop_codon:yes gene_type:complete
MPHNIKFLTIFGCVRNCEINLEYNYKKIKDSLKNITINWLLIESDSSDNTLKILDKLKKKDKNFNYKSLGKLNSKIKNRIKRLTICREKYLKELKRNPDKFNNFIMIVDLDEKMDLFSHKGFVSCFKTKHKWSVCSATQKDFYYDIFAFRHKEISPMDPFSKLSLLNKKNKNYIKNLETTIYSKMIDISKINYWFEVESAFGGTSIYQKKDLLKLTYFSKDNKKFKFCEHVFLNKKISTKKKKIFINPFFKNYSRTVHFDTWKYRYFRFWFYNNICKTLLSKFNFLLK